MSGGQQSMGAGVPSVRAVPYGRAVVAGIIGGILIDLFLVLTGSAPFPGIYQFVASGLVGKVAFSSPSYIWLGVVLHFVISIVWALLYAWAAGAAHTLGRWVLGGLVFGIVVMVVMQLVEKISHTSQPMTFAAVVGGLIAHVVFFGWPVGWFLSRPVAAKGTY